MRKEFSVMGKSFVFLAIFALCLPVFAIPDGKPGKSAKKLTEDKQILHVLNRLGFGPAPGDIEKVRRMGIKQYIEQQLNASSVEENRDLVAGLGNLEVLNLSTSDIFAKYPNPGALIRRLEGNGRQNRAAAQNTGTEAEQRSARQERRAKLQKLYAEYNLKPANQIMIQVQAGRIMRAAYSERQLEETMVDFWSNHFNVYSRKGATRWYIPSYERDVIRKNALGNFRDLLVGTAQHPAMLFYLDNFQSVQPAPRQLNRNQQRLKNSIKNGELDPFVRDRLKRRGRSDQQIDRLVRNLENGGNNQRGINENYARELMELHTLGVDAGYTAEDIKDVARAFTGWTIFDARGYRKAAANMIKGSEDRQIVRQAQQLGLNPNTESGTFVFASRLHDNKEKVVLGQKIDEGGIKDGLKVIDILIKHPATSKHIARKLVTKFVNDEPSEALVNEVAAAFRKSDGDIKTTLRALFSSDEFFAPANYRAKIKTPFELLASSMRALEAKTRNPRPLINLLTRMGEPLYGYQAPTGYPDTAADWVNTGGLLERMNFAVALASNRLPQTSVDLNVFDGGSSNATLERAIDRILHGEITPATKSALIKQLENPLPELKLGPEMDDDEEIELPMRRGRNRQSRLLEPKGDPEVFKVVGLILGSPEFQRQ